MQVLQQLNNSKETIERASLANAVPVNGKYIEASTPDIEGGALRAGGAPDLYSFKNIGFLAQYAAVGVIYGAFPRTIYPFLQIYLNMEGYQYAAASTLVTMAWSFKTFIGIISDSFPIMGYRRRPYMVIGWTMCFAFLLLMAILPVDDPFHLDLSYRDVKAADIPAHLKNENAPASGAKYILLMMFASLGYVIADVAADGMVVEFAQREPEATRGTTQTMIYLTRTIFSIFSAALIGFCMNGQVYGGEFTWSLQFNHMMAILAVAAAIIIPLSIFCIQEEKVEKENFAMRCREMWTILQQRAIWQIMAMKFFSGIFSNFGAAPGTLVQRHWAHVQPLNDTVFSIVGTLVFAATLWITKKYGLNWDWRMTILWTTIITIIIDSVVSFLTIFDVVRNQWFWLGVPILEELPVGIRFIISTYVVVEVAEKGHEGATYGLLTTISNLSIPLAASFYKNVDAYFNAFRDDVIRDDSDARWQVAYTFIIMYVMKMISLAFLPLLPRQKKEAQELKRTGGSNRTAGMIAIIIAGLSLIWSITTNLLSIFPATSCLKIAGGQGC